MRTTLARQLIASALCVEVALFAGCGADDGASPAEPGASDASDALDGTVAVFAAASLTDAFDEIADAFGDAHPGVTVELNLAGSQALREQILSGAPADVFASANSSNMDQVVEEGAAGEPDVFARNALEIAVPPGNPAGVDGLDDFAHGDLLIGLCAVEVPCGDFAREALDGAGVTPAPDTEEPDVRSLLTKVAGGELDAGIVYRSDVVAADGDVDGIEIPAADNVVAEYPVAALTDAGQPDLAAAFVAYLLSDDGQHILASWGFEPA